MQRVVSVEVPSKDSTPKSLQSNDHAIGLFPIREPVHEGCLKEHVSTTIQVLSVRNYDYWEKSYL